MGLELKVEADEIVANLQAMQSKISHFKRVDIGAELSAWQTKDLNRHRPFTMRWRAQGRAQTKIRPHSLYEMMRSEGEALTDRQRRRAMKGLRTHLQHPITRKQRARLLHPRGHQHWSTRPILREEMLHRLWEELVQVFHEKIRW